MSKRLSAVWKAVDPFAIVLVLVGGAAVASVIPGYVLFLAISTGSGW